MIAASGMSIPRLRRPSRRSSSPISTPKIAFVSDRGDHSFIGIYDVKTRTVKFPFPGVDRDAAPSWSEDGKRFVFSRRPGSPFGVTVQPGLLGAAGAAGAAPTAVAGGRG